MTAPTIISYDDGGSVPTSTAFKAADGVNDALTEILVNQLSWTEPYTAASNVNVYYNGTFYLSCDTSTAGSGYAQFFIADAMTDLTTVSGNRAPSGSTVVFLRLWDTDSVNDPAQYRIFATNSALIIVNKFGTGSTDVSVLRVGKPLNSVVPAASKDIYIHGSATNSGANTAQTGNRPGSTGRYTLENFAETVEGASANAVSQFNVNYFSATALHANPVSGTADTYVTSNVMCEGSSNEPLGIENGVIEFAHQAPFTSQTSQTIGSETVDVWDTYNNGMFSVSRASARWL